MNEKYDKVIEQAIKEMFRRVGLKFDPKKKYPDNFYEQHTWSREESKSFRNWMIKLCKRNFPHWMKHKLDWEVGMFLLDYGWKYKDE
jgi:hypothetical protein